MTHETLALALASTLIACQHTPAQAPPPNPPAHGASCECMGGEGHMAHMGGEGHMAHMGGPGPMGKPPSEEHHERDKRMAEHHPDDHPMMGELGALGVHVYPPPMILKQAERIGLTPEQTGKIRQEMLTTQNKAIDIKAKVEHAKVEAARLLSADKVDEKAVGAQIDEAAKAEAELHKLHLGMILRVRALLTPDQLKKLEERPHHAKPGPGPGKHAAADEEEDDDDDDDDDG